MTIEIGWNLAVVLIAFGLFFFAYLALYLHWKRLELYLHWKSPKAIAPDAIGPEDPSAAAASGPPQP